MKQGRVILDLRGKPVGDGDFLSTSHGYYAYVEASVNTFIKTFFKNLSIWGSSTKQFRTTDYEHAYGYELNCKCKSFLVSTPFKVMCERSVVELIICDDETGKDAITDFFRQYKSL